MRSILFSLLKIKYLTLAVLVIFGINGFADEGSKTVKLDYIGQQVIPHDKQFQDTVVGGLSSLDYDSGTNKYSAICDDRSKENPARFYELSLDFDLTGFHSVQLSAGHYIKQPDGSLYPQPEFFGKSFVDPEALRLSPTGNSYFWASEGHVDHDINPTIQEMARDGRFMRNLEVPEKYLVTGKKGKGARDNLVFEGMTLAHDGQSLIVATEGPLLQDGPEATTDHGAMVRLLQMDISSGQAIHEYAYPIDPVHKESLPFGNFSVNGVVDILAVRANEYIVVERSFSTGAGLSVRLYLADISEASNVLPQDSLKGTPYVPVKKTLLLDLSTLGIRIDNIEGISFGHKLEDGRRSLLLISDNNFRSLQVTQILAFAVSGLD